MNSNRVLINAQTRSIASRTLLESRQFDEAERFMAQMLKLGLPPKRGFWDSLIQGLCSDGKDPERAFAVLKNNGIFPSRRTFSLLVCSFSKLGEMGRAIEVLEVMSDGKFRYPIDNVVCSSVISGFCRIGKPELALGFYENAIKVGRLVRPNVVTYTALVSALCREGRISEVSDLVYRMEREGAVLDAVFYSSWICGYFREDILGEVFRKHKAMLEKGIKPDVVSYTILIDGFSKGGNVEKAIGFLNEMKRGGLEPNLVTYTAIMRGFVERGKLDEAFSMFRRVEELGFKLDEVTYGTLIDGLCRQGDLDRVFLLLEEMEKKEISVGTIMYNTVINGLCKVGRVVEADQMSKIIPPDNFTFATLLHGYSQERNFVGILETRKRLEEAGLRMDVVTCNVLIKALFMVGALEDALIIFQGMPKMDLLADSITYFTVIDGLCRVGRIDEALEIFDASNRTAIIPSDACYNCIIRGLCGKGMVDMAIDLFVDLIEKASVPDTATYVMLMKSIFLERNGKGVLMFLNKVEKLGLKSLPAVYNFSINFLCKNLCFGAAIDVYTMMRRRGCCISSKCYYSILKGLIVSGNELNFLAMLNAYIKDYGFLDPRLSKLVVSYFCKEDIDKAIHFLKTTGEHLHLQIPVRVFEALTKQGRSLDAYRLIAEVINGLCRQGCLVEALRLFDSLEQIGVSPTYVTYGSLISTLSNEGYIQDAKQLFEKMIINGCTPNICIYNSLIDGYCKVGFLEEALKLLKNMEESFVGPDSFTVSAVINGCCKRGDMEVALAFYDEYQSKKIMPDFIGFIYLMKGLCVKGRMEEARDILREMLQTQSIVELINEAGINIETESLASFLAFLCEQGSIEEAVLVLDEVRSVYFPSPRRSYGSVEMRKLEGEETLTRVTAKSMISQFASNLDHRCITMFVGKGRKGESSGKRNAAQHRKRLLNEWWWQIAIIVCASNKAARVLVIPENDASFTDNSILAASKTGSEQLKTASLVVFKLSKLRTAVQLLKPVKWGKCLGAVMPKVSHST
ncbi:hypothetical protein Sjap_023022 [Stephania japonica]|uniref:Pentatricopeptide repeat-containing protein n=1 Tax=Stephania japonica TaxID=461633 RepID=A0AAP0EPY5_9MAGN